MGRSITVYNSTSKTIKLTYRSVGHKDKSKSIDIESSGEKKIDFKRNEHSETLIFSIDDKAFRAVKINQIIRVLEIENDLIIIDIASRVSKFRYLTQKYKERVERDLNWNFVCFNDEYRKDANKNINLRNDVTEVFGKIINEVLEKSANIKCDANIFLNYLKVKEIEERIKTDPKILENIKRINYQLIEISRAIEIDYPYLKEEIQIDNAKCFEFLHNRLIKMNSADMLIYLENCGVEEAIPVYRDAIDLEFKIFNEIRILNENKITKLEQNYIRLCINKFESMWGKIINDITDNITVKTGGFIYKFAEFRHQGQLIYKVKSFKENRITEKINDIKEIFIKNRKYQVNYVNQWIEEWRKKSNLNI